MAEKVDDLPPSYADLDFVKEPVASPSAPTILGENSAYGSRDPAVILSVPVPDEDAQRIPDLNPLPLVFEDIYDACVHYVNDNCCYGSKFIEQMKLTNINNTRALYYVLESYGETRKVKYSSRPYRGGPVDGPENGPVPDAWDVHIPIPTELFKDDWTCEEIPHTQKVETCYRCRGTGQEKCSKCNGIEHGTCNRCFGTGRYQDVSCSYCRGSGKESCTHCTRGKATCGKCDGKGKLVQYKRVDVTWTNHRKEFVTDTGKLPRKLLLKTKPTVLFEEESYKVKPVITSDETVNAASVRMLTNHDGERADELIVRQRHVLTGFPFTEIHYTWRDINKKFYVYGLDREVYFELYPQQCCWCTCC